MALSFFSFFFFVFSLSLIQTVHPFGCISKICEGNDENNIVTCYKGDSNDCQYSGSYMGARDTNQILPAVDLTCGKEGGGEVKVFAPFDGSLKLYRPYGDGTCVDRGLIVQGVGSWAGFVAIMYPLDPYHVQGNVSRGEVLGVSIPPSCRGDSRARRGHPTVLTFFLLRHGSPVDPTSHLRECMCTGRVCESNDFNTLIGHPFRDSDKGYGRGFVLRCEKVVSPKIKILGNVPFDVPSTSRSARIFSPIDGKLKGRFRVRNGGEESSCDNEGIFIEGRDRWEGYSVRIFNAKLVLPNKFDETFAQGKHIGNRLDCPRGEGLGEAVFLEFRYKGVIVNVTDQLLGSDCKKPVVY